MLKKRLQFRMNNYFVQLFHNKYLIVPVLTWFFIQTFKVIWDLVTTKKFNFKRIMGAGGMPSSHTAVVMVITIMIGKDVGFGSYAFAATFIFSLIVMYDAAGVRRAVGKQAKVLNDIIQDHNMTNAQKLQEMTGHTPIQVTVGAIIGLIAGLLG